MCQKVFRQLLRFGKLNWDFAELKSKILCLFLNAEIAMNYVEFNPKALPKRIDVARCPQWGLEDALFFYFSFCPAKESRQQKLQQIVAKFSSAEANTGGA